MVSRKRREAGTQLMSSESIPRKQYRHSGLAPLGCAADLREAEAQTSFRLKQLRGLYGVGFRVPSTRTLLISCDRVDMRNRS